MKQTYHLCLSAGDEAMFRDLEDYHMGFNYFALALHKTGSTGLVEAFMSTHTHQLVQTADPDKFMHCFRQPYSMYFNHKYHRAGKLGENRHFTLEVVGYHHNIAAASYVLRNALHHGAAPIPYAYPHCSANSIFRKELGKFLDEDILPKRFHSRFLSRRAEYPDTYKMTESGVFTRESVLNIPQVESMFVSPRAYNYYMSRRSSEECEAEQIKDGNNLPPVNLDAIESGIRLHSTEKMLMFENGKSDYRKISDIDLCTELNSMVQVRFHKPSVYCLTEQEQNTIANELYRNRHINEAQIRRCLAMSKRH
jgi:hypothetical protein